MHLRNFMKRLSYRLRKDGQFRRAFCAGCGAVAIVVVLVVVLASYGKEDERSLGSDDAQAGRGAESFSAGETEDTPYPVPADAPLEEDRYPDVNSLATRYLTAIANGDTDTISKLKQSVSQENLVKFKVESTYIDAFTNIKVFTKPGPVEGSYVAMIYYDLVFVDVPDTLAPGITSLYIVTGPEGLQISNGEIDPKTETYITEITQQNDVAELMNSVKEKYQVAIDGSNSLKAFMEVYPDTVEKKVSEALANGQNDGEDTGEDDSSQTICIAVETVNVRTSDSENADKIGKLQTGERVTRLKAQENGWSLVSFNGSEAYVKSEYLKEDGKKPENEDQGKPADTGDKNAGSTGIAIDTVNLRVSASQDSKKIGVVYQNESFKIVETQGEWTMIEYGDKTGFVKSEFIK